MAEVFDRHSMAPQLAPTLTKTYEGSVQMYLDSLSDKPQNLGRLLDAALNVATTRCQVDTEAAELDTWEAWVTAMQAGSAMFEAARITEGTVECRIADEMRTIPATGPRHHANPASWVTAFWLAVICREQGRMDRLATVPLDVLRAAEARVEGYVYPWVDALQTYWREAPGLMEKLNEAIDATDPDRLRVVDRERMLCLLYPPIEMFYAFLRQDQDAFNDALRQALQQHKVYWSHEDRQYDCLGAVALGPLAVACMALDAGFRIDIESPYLPACLLDRSWLGEFDT
jgi:hypothetical protein